MKLKFVNAENIIDGIELLKEDLGFEITENTDITVEIKRIEEDKLSIKKKDDYIVIAYKEKARFFRGLACAVKWIKDSVKEKELTENPLFNTNGAMFDMSRNAVMNVKTVKTVFRKMALMGLNMFMLYTEDTYEIEGYPYFGHLRGRYSKDDLKDMDKYALKLGIELIPCIQTLGHLATHLVWSDAGRYKDGATTLLAGSDETYKLIDAMFRTVSECFTTKRVHIGMDETFDLGTGNYLETNGFKPRDEIFFEHMARVRELAFSHNLKPMMWSDMIFRLAGKNIRPYFDYHVDVEFTPEVLEKIPQGIAPVFWDYYHPDQNWYDINIKKHQKYFKEEMMFAGGIWTWSGHCPSYTMSFKNTIAALKACKENNAKEVVATVWLNGSEGMLITALAGLAWYASFDYSGEYDIDLVRETFDISCNASYDDMLLYELPELSIKEAKNSSRALLYNDPLLGIADSYITSLKGEYFKDATKQLEATKPQKIFEASYNTILMLSKLLENKADFGIRLKAAYDNDDKTVLNEMLKECDVIIEKITALKNAHRSAWFEYYNPFGWEIHDMRYGGLVNRFDTVKLVLSEYLEGKTDSIPELMADRLPLNAHDIENTFCWTSYGRYSTAGVMR